MSERGPKRRNSKLGPGIAIGMGLGTAIGVASDNLGLWVANGLVLGIAVGTAMDQREGAR